MLLPPALWLPPALFCRLLLCMPLPFGRPRPSTLLLHPFLLCCLPCCRPCCLFHFDDDTSTKLWQEDTEQPNYKLKTRWRHDSV
jgi:hypothetical protein